MRPTIKNDAHTAEINGSGLKDPVILAAKLVPQLGHSLLMELQTASQVLQLFFEITPNLQWKLSKSTNT
jgi:hypothetical protein